MKLKIESIPVKIPSTTKPVYQVPSGMKPLNKSIIDPVNQPIQLCRKIPIDGTLIPVNTSPASRASSTKPSYPIPVKKLIQPGFVTSTPNKPFKNSKSSEKTKWNTTNIIRRKIGILQIRWVNTLSILSDFEIVLSFSFLITVLEKLLVIYLYLSSATIASKSPSKAELSTFDFNSLTSAIISLWLATSKSSFSINFIAWNNGLLTLLSNCSAVLLTNANNSAFWITVVPFLGFLAILYAFFINSSIPSPFKALISTTGMPNFFSNSLVKIVVPNCFTTSIMFNAIIIGASTSNNWVVKYRFLSRLVASTTLIIQSGCSSITKLSPNFL